MHQSFPSANIPWQPPRFCTYFQSGSRGSVSSELPGVIKVPSCQLMPHEGTFQLQTDLPSIAALRLENLFQSWGKTLKLLSMVLKLKQEGMTKE